MTDIKIFIEHLFKDKLTPEKYSKYVRMGEIMDLAGEQSYIWDHNDAQTYMNINSLFVGLDSPVANDWVSFLNEQLVADFLFDSVIKSKRVTIRRIISKLNENNSISQGEMKALEALKDLIQKSDESENKTIYVQYISPIRFDNNDSKAIVEKFLYKEDL